MGIHDRDWYKEEMKQREGRSSSSTTRRSDSNESTPSAPKGAEPVYVPRRQTGSLPHVRYTPIGLPRWFIAMVWAVLLIGLLAFFQAWLKR